MKEKLQYIGKHQPNDIIEVESDKAIELIRSGMYVYFEKPLVVKTKEPVLIKETESKKPNDFPKAYWTEKKIHKWIKDKNISVEYDIKKETKNEIIRKLDDYYDIQ